MSEERSAGRSSREISGREFVRTAQRRMRTQFISCKSRPSALTKPARHHTSLDSLASYFSKHGRCSPTRQMWSECEVQKRAPQGQRNVLLVPEAERAIHHVPDLDRLQYTWYESRAVQRCQPSQGHCLRQRHNFPLHRPRPQLRLHDLLPNRCEHWTQVLET